MNTTRITIVVSATIVLAVSLLWIWPRVIDGRDRATRHHQYDESSMNTIVQLVLQFESIAGRLPHEDAWREDLLTLANLADKKAEIFNDSWGRPYQYRILDDGGRFEIATLGRDGVLGGIGEEKDIVIIRPDQ